MVLPILLNKKYVKKKITFLNKIEAIGLETRPIISGSLSINLLQNYII